ncbi:hypothetical protein [Streptomyces syringium]|uniref:hypothetical protein n=1 Tax=Streptomyces syringium TaxID=76729 RepID=UPI0037D65591
MTTPNRLEMPARRRRHARLIATLAELIGDCAAAASSVYGPIAEAPPEQVSVPVSLWAARQLSASASTRLDKARVQDDERWPTAVAKEKEDDGRTFAARCAAADVEQILSDAEFGEEAEPPHPDIIPLPALPQLAAMALAQVGAEFLAELQNDPEQAIGQARDMTATGEFTLDQILDEAADTAVLSGLMALSEAQRGTDPSAAAEGCLAASRYFALAILVSSADVDEATD